MHAMLKKLEAAKMTKKTEQDLVIKALAEKDSDTIVTLSATVSEQEGGCCGIDRIRDESVSGRDGRVFGKCSKYQG